MSGTTPGWNPEDCAREVAFVNDTSFAAPSSSTGEPPRLRIEVDHMRCVGAAMCVELAPGVFALNHWRRSEVVDPEGDTLADILEAAGNCPTSAIAVSNAVTGEILLP